MARLPGTARSDIEISYCRHPVNENNNHYNGHYFFFHRGGFQSCPLFSHYLFHYFVTYSEFGPENNLMVILMDSIMGQLMATLKAPIDIEALQAVQVIQSSRSCQTTCARRTFRTLRS